MGRHKYIVFVPLLLAVSSLVLAFSSGPPDGRTGAPSESTCQVGCHNSFSLNSGDGSFAINTPATYQSGDTIDVELDLADNGQMRWGFEITALDAGNQPAGELLVVDVEVTRTQKSVPASGRQYIKHRTAGTNPGVPNVAPGWTLKWVANGGVSGPVTFYAAGNAANNASGNQGDFIYTTSAMIDEQVISDPTIFVFRLDSKQADACSGTGSSASGYGLAILSPDSSQLSFHIVHDVVSPIDAHIHLGAPCVDGGVLTGFSSPLSPIIQTWSLTANDLDDLVAGNLYVNIHSSDFPAGEIRGQIVQQPLKFIFSSDEGQANSGAGTGSLASGIGVAELSADGSQLSIELRHDVDDPIDGHIHLGAPGVDGAVQFGFSDFSSPIVDVWMLDTSDIRELISGNLYSNIHSTAFPPGEIRGQIVPSGGTFVVTMDGDQADAGSGTGSEATGFCVFTLSPDQCEFSIYCEHDVTGVIDGHVHLGAPGVSGPVQFGFSDPTSPIIESWTLSPDELDNFVNGDFYVNIHSAAFPPGEIRGQLSLFEEQSFSFTVDEAQANDCNGTGSSATGLAEVKLKPGGLESTISIVHDVSNVIDGHVHLGEKCVSGDVQFGFDSPLSTVTEIWYLSSEDVINLMQGDLYVNIHSMTFQDGEIRGQIENSIPTSCCVGLTGNVDGDPTDMVDLGDLTALIDFLFISFTPPECMAEANVDGDPSGSIDLGDLTALIDFLFISFTLPAECL